VKISFLRRYLLAAPASGITSMQDLVTKAKAAPGRLNYASAGIGGTQHLSGEMFKSRAKVFVTHIPYRGSGPAQADFLGNQIPLMVDSVTAALPHIRAGKAVALGVTSGQRTPQLPDVPTVAESGVPELKGFEVEWPVSENTIGERPLRSEQAQCPLEVRTRRPT
jgi:tripartite-type tricarboxylate transporter receptor subunit TctC